MSKGKGRTRNPKTAEFTKAIRARYRVKTKLLSEIEAETSTCSICKHEFTGHGNNAQPINSGRCCGDCNWMVVIPARIDALYQRERGK
jgi:hypothetical protein